MDFWKTHPYEFHEKLSQLLYNIRSIHIWLGAWMRFPEISLAQDPKF